MFYVSDNWNGEHEFYYHVGKWLRLGPKSSGWPRAVGYVNSSAEDSVLLSDAFHHAMHPVDTGVTQQGLPASELEMYCWLKTGYLPRQYHKTGVGKCCPIAKKDGQLGCVH